MRRWRRYRAMQRALQVIAVVPDGRCETFSGPPLCPDTHRSPWADYSADRWCDTCIARAGLAGVDLWTVE